MIAIPSAPPVCRNVLTTPEATPASCTGSDPIAVVVVGAIASPIPIPQTARPGSRSTKFDDASTRESRSSPVPRNAIPAVIGQRGPIPSVLLPAIGAIIIISSVVGRKLAPALIAE